MSKVLQSILLHNRNRQRLAAVGVAAARRAWPTPAGATGSLMVLMRRAAMDGSQSVGDILAEQGIDAQPEADVNPTSLSETASDGRQLTTLLQQAESVHALEVMVLTQIADASRVAAGIGIASRKNVGWVRQVNPPCCPRCAILAGAFFRWNQGFQRHPLCDCTHIPTQENVAGDVRTDPKSLFDQGQVTNVTKAESKALSAGADPGQVIHARRSLYMDTAGRKLTREAVKGRGVGGIRVTPEQIYREAGDDREEALRLLDRFGYLR